MSETYEIDPRILGQRIAEARKARGRTQEELAAYLGCSRPTYIAIEKGDRPAKADEILRLAPYLGRAVNDLVRPAEPVMDFHLHLRAVADKSHVRVIRAVAASIRRSTSCSHWPKTIANSSGW